MLRLSLIALLWTMGAASADVWTFETPSQNIQCSVGEERSFSDIRCTIIERQGAPALPLPDGCKAAWWGHTFEMNDRGPVRMVCMPLDRTRGAHSVADYGVRGEFAGFDCLSSTNGLECRNRDGNGFRLARKQQTVLGPLQANQPNHTPFAEFDVSQDQIRNYQTRLNQLGFDAGPADGIPGKRTAAAVRNFQKDHGFLVTGILTNANVTRLIQETSTQPQNRQRSAKTVGYEDELKRQRKFIEEQLMQIGFDPGPVDGVTDQKTIAAFNAFQRQFGLKVQHWLSSDQKSVLEALVVARKSVVDTRKGNTLEGALVDKAEARAEIRSVKTVENHARNVAHQRQVEEQLNALGFDVGIVDGKVDALTIAAVNAFQRANNLEVMDWLPRDQRDLLARRVAGSIEKRNMTTKTVSADKGEMKVSSKVASPAEQLTSLDAEDAHSSSVGDTSSGSERQNRIATEVAKMKQIKAAEVRGNVDARRLSRPEARELSIRLQALGLMDPRSGKTLGDAFSAYKKEQFGEDWRRVPSRATLEHMREKMQDTDYLITVVERKLALEDRLAAVQAANKARKAKKQEGVFEEVTWDVVHETDTSRSVQLKLKDGGRLNFYCQFGSASRKQQNSIWSTKGNLGRMTLQVDQGRVYEFDVKSAPIYINTESRAKKFTALMGDMANGTVLFVGKSDGSKTRFPMPDAAKFIGGCAVPVFTTVLMSEQEEMSQKTIGPDATGRFNGTAGPFIMATFLKDGLWCAPHVTMRANYAQDVYEAYNAKAAPQQVTDFARKMREACPEIRSIDVFYFPSPGPQSSGLSHPRGYRHVLGAPDNFVAPTGYTNIEKIMGPEEQTKCDQLVGMRGDFDKPFGAKETDIIEAGLLPDAEIACREAVRADQDNRRLNALLGRVLTYQGRFGEAYEVLEKAKALGSGAAMNYLGTLQVEGWGTAVNMREGNRNWRQSDYYGGYNTPRPGSIAKVTSAPRRPTFEERERAQVAKMWQQILGVYATTLPAGKFTMCNQGQAQIRYATIAAMPFSEAVMFVEGYTYLEPDECILESGNVTQGMLYGVAVQRKIAGVWRDPGYDLNPTGSLPHRFTAICAPVDGRFLRNETGLAGHNTCREGDTKMKVTFNLQVGGTDFTMNVN